MGMLRVKVGASWIDIPAGPPGPGVPLGGALGTVLMKNSAADLDTRWTNTLTAPLTILTDTSAGGSASSSLQLAQSNLANNEGGQLGFPGWGATYNTDMYFDRFQNSLRVVYGGNIIGGFVGPGYGLLNGSHPTWGTGYAALWRNDRPGGGDYALMLGGNGDTYLNASTGSPIHFRINNVEKMTLGDGSYLTLGPGVNGITVGYGGSMFMGDATWMRFDKNIFCNTEIRAGNKFSFDMGDNGHYVLTHSVDTDTGFYYDSDGFCGFVCNGGWALQAQAGRVYSPSYRINSIGDANHQLTYSNAVPPQSGEGSNGPLLQGYTSVWLYNVAYGKSLYLGAGGNVFINSGNAYQTFSSRRLKDNIEDMDAEACLAMVRRWRVVEFDYKDDDEGRAPLVRHKSGFISEEMYETTPSLVNVTGADDVIPNWPNAIDLPGMAPFLAGAIQALLDRIQALEAA